MIIDARIFLFLTKLRSFRYVYPLSCVIIQVLGRR